MTIVNHQTNECSLVDCFCHEAQRLESVSQSSPSSIVSNFEHEWNHAPRSMTNYVEREVAKLWFRAGARAKETELLELFNDDL